MEGRLADYNLALDKIRTKTRPEDIISIYEHIKVRTIYKRIVINIFWLNF